MTNGLGRPVNVLVEVNPILGPVYEQALVPVKLRNAAVGTRLEGGTLSGLEYEPLATSTDGSVRNEVLGLHVRVDERPSRSHLLCFRDPKTGRDVLTFEESEHGRLEAERWRHQAEHRQYETERMPHEEERRRLKAERAQQDAEVELVRLRAEIARLEGGQEGGTGGKS